MNHFASGKKNHIHVFDKKIEKYFTSKSRNIASENFFYDFMIGENKVTYEHSFADLEGKCSKIIKKIIISESIENLSEDEIIELAHFTAVQFSRTRKMRNMFKEVEELVIGHTTKMGFAKEKIKGMFPPLSVEEIQRNEIQSMIESIPNFTAIILQKSLILMRAPRSSTLYISDHPVVLDNNLLPRTAWRSNLGLAVKGVEIYFPIHPEFTLCFMCPDWAETIRVSYNQVMQIMDMGAHLLGGKDFSSVIEMYDTLFRKKTFKLHHDNVVRLNSIQGIQSTRFIFSQNEDFDLLKEMRSKGDINSDGRTLSSGFDN